METHSGARSIAHYRSAETVKGISAYEAKVGKWWGVGTMDILDSNHYDCKPQAGLPKKVRQELSRLAISTSLEEGRTLLMDSMERRRDKKRKTRKNDNAMKLMLMATPLGQQHVRYTQRGSKRFSYEAHTNNYDGFLPALSLVHSATWSRFRHNFPSLFTASTPQSRTTYQHA